MKVSGWVIEDIEKQPLIWYGYVSGMREESFPKTKKKTADIMNTAMYQKITISYERDVVMTFTWHPKASSSGDLF